MKIWNTRDKILGYCVQNVLKSCGKQNYRRARCSSNLINYKSLVLCNDRLIKQVYDSSLQILPTSIIIYFPSTYKLLLYQFNFMARC